MGFGVLPFLSILSLLSQHTASVRFYRKYCPSQNLPRDRCAGILSEKIVKTNFPEWADSMPGQFYSL
jgi:hypothetical protein